MTLAMKIAFNLPFPFPSFCKNNTASLGVSVKYVPRNRLLLFTRAAGAAAVLANPPAVPAGAHRSARGHGGHGFPHSISRM